MMRFLGVCCVLSVFVVVTSMRAQETLQIVDGKKISKSWKDVVGRVVMIEGLAWGVHEKGLGQRVILDGSSVYVSHVDFGKQDVEGRLVRVRGTLRKKLMRAAPKGTQGYGDDFEYFSIEAQELVKIDRVTWPWMQEAPPTK